MQGAISSDECETLSQALEHAWEIFLRAKRLDRHNLDISKPTLLYGILEAFKEGERHARRLAIRAVASFDRFEPIVRHHRGWSSHAETLTDEPSRKAVR
jgi:hypothetical protein